MEEKRGDIRIYIITGFIFVCIVAGGIFLGLYIFLPVAESKSWYPIAGIVLVAIPWAFWFLMYIYRCCAPKNVQSQERSNMHRSAAPSTTTRTTNERLSVESPISSPDGKRHVHFGAVVVLGTGDKVNNVGGGDEDDEDDLEENNSGRQHEGRVTLDEKSDLVASRESEMPLTLGVSSS
ncbi:hypothetical protein HS088_TW15G00786 [Tripterygium wilfordii]|uniref:Membrane lipoprotein n=1 Tax=Tripterygium wilfordii TaxID=458696 RepID=A0A7J7CMJ4_TRIWF|nr:uncharacterized protein LOC119979784 [Tripterygium wilfordii]KAF5735284.1 hypothetical protein HS088_TW15G00786 [Tripterygium wilfordii]